MTEREKNITSRAEEMFGKERTQQLQIDVEQLASDLEQLRAVPLEIDDEP